MYDADTVCLLQPLDVFGPLYLPPSTVVEAVTDIKLYCISRDDFDALPMHITKVCCYIRIAHECVCGCVWLYCISRDDHAHHKGVLLCTHCA
jgi:hypothetical protein